MGFFSIFEKTKEGAVGGISIIELDKIKKHYVPNPTYSEEFNYIASSQITKDNILFHLNNGLDVNFILHVSGLPIFLTVENRDLFDIMAYFGADVELKNLKPETISFILHWSFFLYDDYKDFILSLPVSVHKLTTDIKKLEWLKMNKVDFNRLIILPYIDEIFLYDCWHALLNPDNQESIKFIIDQTNFDFNLEINYSNHNTMTGIAKVWFVYAIKYLYSVKGNESKKIKARQKEFEKFLLLTQDKFSVNDVNSLGQNVYFMLQKTPKVKHLLVQVFLDIGVNPFIKDHSGHSFYDLMKLNPIENQKVIEVLEHSKFYNFKTDLIQPSDSENTKESKDMLNVSLDQKPNKRINLSEIVNEKVTVVTGTVEGYTRREYENYLSGLGARISSEVNGKTEVLIVGENPGSKVEKAAKLGVEIIRLSTSENSVLSELQPKAVKFYMDTQENPKSFDQKLLSVSIIRNIFSKHRIFDEVDCEQDIEALAHLNHDNMKKGVFDLLDLIKDGLLTKVFMNVKNDIEDYIEGNLEIVDEPVQLKQMNIVVDSPIYEDKVIIPRIECPIITSLSSQQRKIIRLISQGKEDEVQQLLNSPSDWAFSFDCNVNLLHLALIFNCNKIATYLIDQNIDIHQVITDEVQGELMFNQKILNYLTALDIARRNGMTSMVQRLEALIKLR